MDYEEVDHIGGTAPYPTAPFVGTAHPRCPARCPPCWSWDGRVVHVHIGTLVALAGWSTGTGSRTGVVEPFGQGCVHSLDKPVGVVHTRAGLKEKYRLIPEI